MNTARGSCVVSVRSTPRKTKNGSVSDGSGLSRAMSLSVVILPPLTPKRSDTWYVSVASSASGLVVLEVLLVVVLGFVAAAPEDPLLGALVAEGLALGERVGLAEAPAFGGAGFDAVAALGAGLDGGVAGAAAAADDDDDDVLDLGVTAARNGSRTAPPSCTTSSPVASVTRLAVGASAEPAGPPAGCPTG